MSNHYDCDSTSTPDSCGKNADSVGFDLSRFLFSRGGFPPCHGKPQTFLDAGIPTCVDSYRSNRPPTRTVVGLSGFRGSARGPRAGRLEGPKT